MMDCPVHRMALAATEGCDDLPEALFEVQNHIGALKDLEAELRRQLIADMREHGERYVTIGDQGFDLKSKAGKIVWDDDLLVSKLMDVASEPEVDPESGEIISDPPLERFADMVRSAAAINYWRVGALKELQLDPDKYRTTEWAGYTLVPSKKPPPTPDGKATDYGEEEAF